MPTGAPFPASRSLLQQCYHAPRELEHPLHALCEVEARTLVWIQPQLLVPAYELWAGEKVVATLRYRDIVRPGALGVSADGLWTFEEAATGVQLCQRGQAVAILQRCDALNAVLVLNDGSLFHWMRKEVWQDVWIFVDEQGNTLLQFIPEASPRARARVLLAPGVEQRPEASLLALSGQYLMLSRRS